MKALLTYTNPELACVREKRTIYWSDGTEEVVSHVLKLGALPMEFEVSSLEEVRCLLMKYGNDGDELVLSFEKMDNGESFANIEIYNDYRE